MSVLLQRAAAAARTPESLPVDVIRTNGGTQARLLLNLDIVAEYADAMKRGVMFPPVVVYYDGATYWLADGFHRVAAHKQARPDEPIFAEIRQGTRRDAVLCAVGANTSHGLRRTAEDKRNAVLTLLRDEEWGKWSDREIARVAQVSPTSVGGLRKSHTVQMDSMNGDERTFIHHKTGQPATMQTANIGKSQPGEDLIAAVREWAMNESDILTPAWHLQQAARTRTNAYASLLAHLRSTTRYADDDQIQAAIQSVLASPPPHTTAARARCSRCGRELTDPAAIAAGIGPCCARKPAGGGMDEDDPVPGPTTAWDGTPLQNAVIGALRLLNQEECVQAAFAGSEATRQAHQRALYALQSLALETNVRMSNRHQ